MATDKNFRKASTLPELMVVMIVAGVVIGLLFDGVELFRRYSGQIAGFLTQNSELLTVTNWLTVITESSDSLRQEDDVKVYRKGAVQTTISISDSLLVIGNDTLPIKVTVIEVKENPNADTLRIETEQRTLYFTTRRKPDTEVMKQIEAKENEVTLEK